VSTTTLDAALDGVQLAVVDTSAWLAFLSAGDATHRLARHLFGRVAAADDPLRAEASMVTAAESMVRPAAAGPAELGRMRAYLAGFPHLTLVPVDLDVATTAATVRAQSKLSMPDALIVATALTRRAQAVVTNDETWRPRLASAYPQLRWLDLYAHL